MSNYNPDSNKYTANGKRQNNKTLIIVIISLIVILLSVLVFLAWHPFIIGHTWEAATCTKPDTCSVCGATQGSALGHSWELATCTKPATCMICGATQGNALGHTWTPANCIQPAICSVCGATQGSALGHTWKAATATAPRTCVVCGQIEGNPLPTQSESELIEKLLAFAKEYTQASIVEVDSIRDEPNGRTITIHCYDMVEFGDGGGITQTRDWICYNTATESCTDLFGNELDITT